MDVERVCAALQALWEQQTGAVVERKPQQLSQVLDMRRAEHLSKKQTIVSAVDIASVVSRLSSLRADLGLRARP